MTTLAHDQPLVVRSEKIPDPGPLVDVLPDSGDAVAFLRGGDGIVGYGEIARLEVTGNDRFEVADRWWRSLVAGFEVDDAVGVSGSGPVLLGSFSFSPAGRSVLVVPRVLLGRKDGITWCTIVGPAGPTRSPALRRRPEGVTMDVPARLPGYRSAVETAVEQIAAGRMQKVVLASAVDAHAAEPLDARALLARLADAYPECWSFLVADLVGATPELLVERFGSAVHSRVLAGSAPLEAATAAENDLPARELLTSAKNLEEHRYAAESVARGLRSRCSDVHVPEGPSLLRLTNVAHLASDLDGTLGSDVSALALVGALHPTAAVAGAPTDAALAAIIDLEDVDRGRYAGPVGWTDAAGDGQWCIALRCAQLDGPRARLWAGCGIVAGSIAEDEAREFLAKLRPVRDALAG